MADNKARQETESAKNRVHIDPSKTVRVKKCNKCGNVLQLGDNWSLGCYRAYHNICKECKRKSSLAYNRGKGAKPRTPAKEKDRKYYRLRSRKNRIKYPETYSYLRYKHGAKQRNLEFNLTKEEFLQFYGKPCFYCGDAFDNNGLDRVDNTQGYQKDNIVPCCYRCNWMKSDLTVEVFINHCEKIVGGVKCAQHP